ncbi:MAG TPA: butyrate kinase [bacterium]|nr:butyrate kinase [bacterium]HPR87202.1 butyrate kinase [bacterium]
MTAAPSPLILVINPGSTSTKVALFAGRKKVSEESLSHSKDDLARFKGLWDQFDYRTDLVIEFLNRQNLKAFSLAAVVGRGGMLKSVSRGTYIVDDTMIADAQRGVQGEHVSNLGCAIAGKIAQLYGSVAFIVDPVSVDEFEPLARFSGHPRIQRRALSHALSLRAAAFWAAEALNIDANTHNFIVAHLGGGISIAPVKGGRIIDVNDASSDGPFSPERTGSLPLQPFIDLCYSGEFTRAEMRQLVMGKGGLLAYLGTHDAREVEKRIEAGDDEADMVFRAMAYQIAKEIGAMTTVLNGQVAAVVLTGGLAHSQRLVGLITARVGFVAPLRIFPGELELEAMASGALRVLNGQEKARHYPK